MFYTCTLPVFVAINVLGGYLAWYVGIVQLGGKGFGTHLHSSLSFARIIKVQRECLGTEVHILWSPWRACICEHESGEQKVLNDNENQNMNNTHK